MTRKLEGTGFWNFKGEIWQQFIANFLFFREPWIKIKHKLILHKSRQKHDLERFVMKSAKSDRTSGKKKNSKDYLSEKYEHQTELIMFSWESNKVNIPIMLEMQCNALYHVNTFFSRFSNYWLTGRLTPLIFQYINFVFAFLLLILKILY